MKQSTSWGLFAKHQRRLGEEGAAHPRQVPSNSSAEQRKWRVGRDFNFSLILDGNVILFQLRCLYCTLILNMFWK